jgi:hypothetical protein
MPRLIFVNRFFFRFFFPDHSATSQILSDLAHHLASAGRDVHVVTSTSFSRRGLGMTWRTLRPILDVVIVVVLGFLIGVMADVILRYMLLK